MCVPPASVWWMGPVCRVACSSRVVFFAAWFDLDTEHNRWVYVSGLPSAITVEEFVELMSKYGVIMDDEKGEQGEGNDGFTSCEH